MVGAVLHRRTKKPRVSGQITRDLDQLPKVPIRSFSCTYLVAFCFVVLNSEFESKVCGKERIHSGGFTLIVKPSLLSNLI